MRRKPLRVVREIGRSEVTKIKILSLLCSENCCEIDLTVTGRKAPVRVCFIRTDRGIRRLGLKNLSRELFDYCFAEIALKVMHRDGVFLAELRRKETERLALNLTDEDYAKLVRERLQEEADECRRFAADNGLTPTTKLFEEEAAPPPPVKIRKVKRPRSLPLFA